MKEIKSILYLFTEECPCNLSTEDPPSIISINSESESFPPQVILGAFITISVIFLVMPIILIIFVFMTRGGQTNTSGNSKRDDHQRLESRDSVETRKLELSSSLSSGSRDASKRRSRHQSEDWRSDFVITPTHIPESAYFSYSLKHKQKNSSIYDVPNSDPPIPPSLPEVYTEPFVLSTISRHKSRPSTSNSYYSSTKEKIYSSPSVRQKIHADPNMQTYSRICKPLHQLTTQHSIESDIYSEVNICNLEEEEVPEFTHSDLNIIDKLGSSKYGPAFIAEINTLKSSTYKSNNGLIMIKTLNSCVDLNLKDEFFNEIKILSKLNHENLACIIGSIITEEPLSMILQFGENGDLVAFLKMHTLTPSNKTEVTHLNTISFNSLLYIAKQIASGMMYLEMYDFIHRDLAARNCLIGNNLLVKVSNFCVTREDYLKSYCKLGDSIPLPIRWMAYETLFYGRFSIKSDVWAYGVTLWEILTLCRHLPFSYLTDDQVVENTSKCCTNDGKMSQLEQPEYCPKDIYDTMKSCWHTKETKRPPFWEIEMFLKRKNLGYKLDYTNS